MSSNYLGGNCLVTNLHPAPELSSSVDEFEVEGIMQRGIAHSVTATIHNASADDYIGSVNIDMYEVKDGVLKGPAVAREAFISKKDRRFWWNK